MIINIAAQSVVYSVILLFLILITIAEYFEAKKMGKEIDTLKEYAEKKTEEDLFTIRRLIDGLKEDMEN